MPTLKKVFRASEKVVMDYGGDWSGITDMVRGSLIASSITHVHAIVVALADDPDFTVLHAKNKFTDKNAHGYRDLNVLVKVAGSEHVCEVQIHHKAYCRVKETGAHKVYAQARAVGVC